MTMMRASMQMVGVLLCAGALPGKGAPPILLQPLGKWAVNYDKDMCILSHQFGKAGDVVTFGVRPLPLGERDEILLKTSLRSAGSGDGEIVLEPSGESVRGRYETFRMGERKESMTTLWLNHDDLAHLPDSTAISITVGDRLVTTIALGDWRPAYAALRTCQDDLLRTWGLDPAEQEKIAVRAKGNLSPFFKSDQFPTEALGTGSRKVVAVYEVGLDGKTGNCRIVSSSGVPSLDRTTCAIIRRDGKYRPALGKDGKPIVSDEAISVTWLSWQQ